MSCYSTRAQIRYLVPGPEKPVYFASEGGANAQLKIEAEFKDVEVDILDARELDPLASLDLEGFQLQQHNTAIGDFYSIDTNKAKYEAELAELVLGIVGAKSLFVFDHTLRSDSPEVRESRKTREAAAIIHNDYTDASAKKRVRDLLSEEEAEEKLQNRFAIVNVWRSVAATVYRSPLTCCDAQSVDEENVFASERIAKDRIGELELISHSPAHKWYYFPEMQTDEVLLIKTYDSASNGRAKRSIHTSFENPLAPDGAPPRESMESRMLVFF